MILKSRVYADIESIFDLRHSFLMTKDFTFKEMIEYLRSEEYNFRTVDKFLDGEDWEYYEAIMTGDRKYLYNTQISYMFSTVRMKLLNLAEANGRERIKSTPCLVLNTYPFELTIAEQEAWRDAIFHKLRLNCFVEIVYIEPKDVTPSFVIDNNIKACYIYDFTKWLTLHHKNFMNGCMNEVDVNFPAVNQTTVEKEEQEELNELIKEVGIDDFFDLNKLFLSAVLRVSFRPIVYYTNFIVAKDIIADHEKMALEAMEKERGLKDFEKEELDEYISKQL